MEGNSFLDFLDNGALVCGTGDGSVRFSTAVFGRNEYGPYVHHKDIGPRVKVSNVSFQPGIERKTDGYQTKRLSIFHVTVNTNKRPKGSGDGSIHSHLMLACDGLKYQISNIMDIGNFPRKGLELNMVHDHAGNNHVWAKPWVEHVNVLYGVEVGSHVKGGREHVHIEIQVYHNSFVRVNGDKTKDYFVNYFNNEAPEFGIENVYVKIQHIRGGPQWFVDKYISKPPPSERHVFT